MTGYPTASAHAITMRCVGPALIPIRHRRTSDAAEDGHEAHAECLPAMAGQRPFADSPRGRFLARLGPCEGRIEVAVAVDPRKMQAIELGQGLERDYSGCPPGYIAMTLDLLDTDMPYLCELKTGGAPVESPYRNPQIQTQALGVWLLTGALPEVRLVVAKDDGTGWWSWWSPGVRAPPIGALYKWRARLIGMMSRIDAQRGREPDDLELTPGEHCRYCDVRRARACPAIEDWLEHVGSDAIEEHDRAVVGRQVAKERQEDAELALDGHPDVEIKTSHRRQLDAERAIEAIPGLAKHSHRAIMMGELDSYIRDTKLEGEAWADAKARVEAALFDAGALSYTQSRTLKIARNE